MREVLCRRMRDEGLTGAGVCNGGTVTCGWCDNSVRAMEERP